MIVKEKSDVLKWWERPVCIDWNWLFAHCAYIFTFIFAMGVLLFVIWMIS